MTQHEAFQILWPLLKRQGWRAWAAEASCLPQETLKEAQSYFACREDLFLYFIKIVPSPPAEHFHGLKDYLFELILTRLEYLQEDQTLALEAFCFSSLQFKRQIFQHLYEFFSTPFQQTPYASFKIFFLQGFYGVAFLYSLHHSLEEVMVMVDQGLTFLMPVLCPSPSGF